MISTIIAFFCLVAFEIALSTKTMCPTSPSTFRTISILSASILLYIINTTISSVSTSNPKYYPNSSSQIELATVPADTILLAPTIILSVPPATGTLLHAVFNANLAEVEGYNNLFATMNLSYPCRSNEAACINSSVVRCGCQGKFVITQVYSTGQQCFALPMKTIKGVSVGCIYRAAAIAELGLNSTSISTSASKDHSFSSPRRHRGSCYCQGTQRLANNVVGVRQQAILLSGAKITYSTTLKSLRNLYANS